MISRLMRAPGRAGVSVWGDRQLTIVIARPDGELEVIITAGHSLHPHKGIHAGIVGGRRWYKKTKALKAFP